MSNRPHTLWSRRRLLQAGPLAAAPLLAPRLLNAAEAGSQELAPFSHFTDVAAQAGLTQPIVYGTSGEVTYILESMGGGCAFIDYDNDGWTGHLPARRPYCSKGTPEKAFPDLAAVDSPTRRVGSDLTQELPEVPHTIPVLSLDKSYTHEELAAWIAKSARNARRSFLRLRAENRRGIDRPVRPERPLARR